jgi:nucleoside-triphosphatase THEP1
MRALLDAQRVVLATIGLRPSASSGVGFIAEAKARDDVELWEVTRANRDALVERATAWIGERIRRG